MLQKAGWLMSLMRQEINEFSRASEKLLAYHVNLEELTVMERDIIQYYLSALAEKFPAQAADSSLVKK